DPRREQQPIREHGRVIEYQEVIMDHGAEDKRALVIEAELATVLKRMAGEGNSLSAILRDAWDDRTLGTMTKHSPLRATGAHVSGIGHIPDTDPRLSLPEPGRANGFGNRWLYVLSRRSKCLPTAEPIPSPVLAPLIRELEDVLRFAEG